MTEKAGDVRYLLSDGLGSVRQAIDEDGSVVAYQEFDPYGSPIDNNGGDPYGYTGEWWENEVGLLHLRARWYLPETGTFLSVDPVESEPPYQYVGGNPVNSTDPRGLCRSDDYECIWLEYTLSRQYPNITNVREYQIAQKLPPIAKRLGLRELFQTPSAAVIAQGSSSNVLGLIRLFEADHFPGKDASGRLEWILNITGNPRFLSLQLALFPRDDSGFCAELADQKFYDVEWQNTDPGPNRQMGHFLIAVSLGFDPETAYNNSMLLFDTIKIATTPHILSNNPPVPTVEEFALNLIVGHEMIGDRKALGQAISIPAQYNAATADARNSFLNAVEYDKQRNYDLRDKELRSILIATDQRFMDVDAVEGGSRVGNSMQDLRLSAKGWRFGQEIRRGYSPDGPLQTRQQAADWLKREIYNPSRTR